MTNSTVMPVSLAIIISVAAQRNAELPSLSVCRNDAAAIQTMLNASAKFHEILVLDESLSGVQVKDQLAVFIKKYHNAKVQELVFYFSGHGDFERDEFYFLLSDFSNSKKQATTLSNKVLDNMVRSLKPELFVKIVDACHSGFHYIKSVEKFEERMTPEAGGLDQVYFMFSSRHDQTSWTGAVYSDFTNSIVDCVLGSDVGPLRYASLGEAIRDSFSAQDFQVPYFVIQSDMTAVFFDVTDDMKRALGASSGNPPSPPIVTKEAIVPASLLDRIKEVEKQYVSESIAVERINKIEADFSSYKLPSEVASIFEMIIVPTTSVAGFDGIARWLNRNDAEDNYFVKVQREARVVKVKKRRNPWTAAIGAILSEDDYVYVNETQNIPTGFTAEVKMPYQSLHVVARSNFRAVSTYQATVVPILSATHMRIFWSINTFRTTGWIGSSMVGGYNWASEEVLISDENECARLTRNIFDKMVDTIEGDLRKGFGEVTAHEPPTEAK